MILNSFFPKKIEQEILYLLNETKDPSVIRDKLTEKFPNPWIVIKGTAFSFNISRGPNSGGVFETEEDGYRTRFIIYCPPFKESAPPEEEKQLNNHQVLWTINVQKPFKDEEGFSDYLKKYIQRLDCSKGSETCDAIKSKLHSLMPNFWHVIVGEDFTCVLSKPPPESVFYAKATREGKKIDIVAFRQQGLEKQIKAEYNWDWILFLAMSLCLSVGLAGYFGCDATQKSWVCENYQMLLYTAISLAVIKIAGESFKIKQANRRQS
ncbi:unnamed protein product [Blepharisma stoltei]|uniref:Uncharacterized protein n=1 Tax=Blepharisma stoltei TaxID=1481888 RepID=A0AAU9IU43_9CILI|nr:unnamed protein product [Blepharisma stoltei]